MFVVLVNFTLVDGMADKFLEAMKMQANNSLAFENDCLIFDVCTDRDNENHIFLYEVYENKEAFDIHLKSKHFLEFDKLVTDWISTKTVQILNRI